VIGCVMGYRALRSNWLPNAVFGGVFIGLAVVYMNLAQSVVDMPVMALQFSILLAFMFYVDQSHNVPTVESQTREFNAQPAAGPPPRPIEVSTR
jgi:polysaccharide biosynthesis protein PslJ